MEQALVLFLFALLYVGIPAAVIYFGLKAAKRINYLLGFLEELPRIRELLETRS